MYRHLTALISQRSRISCGTATVLSSVQPSPRHVLLPFLAIFVSGVMAFALIVAGCACIGGGVGLLFSNVAVGLLVMGIGGISMAIGILFCILTGWLGSTIFPWILRKTTDFFQKILYRNKKEERA